MSDGRKKLLSQGFLAVVGLGLIGFWVGDGLRARPEPEPRILGMTLDARRPPDAAVFRELHALGVGHVALVPYAFFRGDTLRFNPDARWYSESAAGTMALADSLRAYQMELVLKPQVWMGGGRFPGDLSFDSAADWETFETAYRAYILHHAEVARDARADWFVVGTELARSAIERPAFWRELIAEVGTIYAGNLTYAANWWGEVDSLQFWDDLDAIGVQAYYPLSTASSPPVDVLIAGWQEPIARMGSLSKQWGKAVIFTEIGYRSMPDAAAEPWVWTPRTGQPDPALQARLFEAFFAGPWQEDWLRGAIIWKWYGSPGRGGRELDFTPQGKPAAEVIGEAYRAASPRSRRLSGGP